jgi:DNA-binding LacI/PurR family transcriptional regulator
LRQNYCRKIRLDFGHTAAFSTMLTSFTDDVLTRGVLQAIRDQAVAVPQDLALIVHTNTGAAPFDFPVSLTRLEVDPSAVIEQAANMLVELMSGNPPAEAIRRIPSDLVCGESC